MPFTDITQRNIDEGDIVAYTASAGQAVSSINVGQVTRMSAKSVWVKDVDPETFQIKIVEDFTMVEDLTQPYQGWNNQTRYHYKKVVHGLKEIDETIIGSPAPHRFLILRKI